MLQAAESLLIKTGVVLREKYTTVISTVRLLISAAIFILPMSLKSQDMHQECSTATYSISAIRYLHSTVNLETLQSKNILPRHFSPCWEKTVNSPAIFRHRDVRHCNTRKNITEKYFTFFLPPLPCAEADQFRQ